MRNIETIGEIRKIGARGFYLYKKTYLCKKTYFSRRSHIRELRILSTGRKENKRQKKGLTRHLETPILVSPAEESRTGQSDHWNFSGVFQMKTITTTISETVKTAGNAKGTRKEVGKISFLVPTLEEVKDHLNTEAAFIMEKTLDTYESNFSQFLEDAIETACKSKLVSKLEPKSITFKNGHSAWTTIEELLEQGQRGQHFAIASQFKTAIGTFIAGLKKSDGFKAAVLSFCTNVQALAETTPANKQVVQKVLDGFLETLEEEDVSRFDKLLTAIGQAIEYTGSSLED